MLVPRTNGLYAKLFFPGYNIELNLYNQKRRTIVPLQ
jgi:hypothetical protein